MSRKDAFHDVVRHALEKDGWTITHDPLILRYELGNLYIDLGAEKVFAAERAGQKIAVEVKSFLKNSAVSEFYTHLDNSLAIAFSWQNNTLNMFSTWQCRWIPTLLFLPLNLPKVLFRVNN
jgi:hypothetical protein